MVWGEQAELYMINVEGRIVVKTEAVQRADGHQNTPRKNKNMYLNIYVK